MNCQRCNSNRVLYASAHCSDLGVFSIHDQEHVGYVPEDLGVGGGDDMEVHLCLDCGQAQGKWPLPQSKLERKASRTTKAITSQFATNVVNYAIENNDGDTAAVLSLMMDGWLTKPTDEIVNQVAECVNALRTEPRTRAIGEQVRDALGAWEHWSLLRPMIIDSDDDDEDDY